MSVSKELNEGLSNGITTNIPETIAPALAGPSINNDETVLVASRGGAVTKTDVNTEGVTRLTGLGLLATAPAPDVDHIADGKGDLTQVGDATPLAGTGECRPVAEAAVAKELVKFLIGEALGRGTRVRDILRGKVTGGGELVVVGKGGEAAGTAGRLEGVAKSRGGCG